MGLFALDLCRLALALAIPPISTPLSVSAHLQTFNGELVHFFRLLQESHYHTRGHARDGKCLIPGLRTQTYSHLKVVHIFLRAHDVEVSSPLICGYRILIELIPTPPQWIRKGYPSEITDTADEAYVGGWTKIDSVQNVITMRSDLHDA